MSDSTWFDMRATKLKPAVEKAISTAPGGTQTSAVLVAFLTKDEDE